MDPQNVLADTALVFDLDGTLVDTAPDLHAAANYTLAHFGYETVSMPIISKFVGIGAKAMLTAALAVQDKSVKASELAAMFNLFLDFYARHIAVHSQIFEGARAALHRAEAAGALLAVCTNKPQYLAEALLTELGLGTQFSAIVGADCVPRPKPDGDHIRYTLEKAGSTRSTAIMIGDSAADRRAAYAAGLPFIYATFGYGDLENDLSEEDFIMPHYDALHARILPQLLKRSST